MDEQTKNIDQRALATTLEALVHEATTIQGSDITEQRSENHEYYSISRFGDEKDGRSKHVSADVLDQVESAKAYYMEAFTTARRPIKFNPQGAGDKTYRESTEYALSLFFEDNDGFEFLRDSLHDAFVAKRCAAHCEWFKDSVIEEVDFNGPLQQLEMALANPAVLGTVGKIKPGPNGTVQTKVKVERDTSYPKLTLIKPEFYFRDPNATYVRDAVFAGWYEEYTRGELMGMGFDSDEVMRLKIDYKLRRDEEDASRKSHDSSWSRQRRFKRSPEQELVSLYYTYVWMDLDYRGNGGEDPQADPDRTKLYKFYWAHGMVLTNPDTGCLYEEVADGKMPFEEWVQYKVSHAENGLCDADLVKSVQWDKSHLRRLIIDNAAMNNTSRWKARHSFIKNPRELLDNNIGSILWVKDMAALEPLPTTPLSPQTFDLQEVLDQEKENRTGLSRLAKGMSGDAISHQNADNMIQRLTNASNRRVLRGVSDYANTFLRNIFLRLYDLGVKNDKRQVTITMGGMPQQITPAQFPKRSRMHVSPALTPDEGREAGMWLMQMHQMMSADESLAQLYTDQHKYKMMEEIFDNFGYSDVTQFLASPQDPQVIQAKQFQQQMAQMAQQMQALTAQLMERETAVKELQAQNKVFETRFRAADIASDNLREDDRLAIERARFEHDKVIDFKELSLEAQQARSVTIGKP